MGAHVSQEEKKKLYFKVFFALFVITVLEVAATFLPGHKIIRDLIIVMFACTKAGAVGYYYMHLSHETKWLRIVAVMPMIILLYVVVLIPDTIHSRPTATYLPIRPRVFAEHHEEHAEAEEASEEETTHDDDAAPAAHEVQATGAAHSEASSAEATVPPSGAPSTTEAAPPAAAAPTAPAAPAAGGGSADEWR